MYPLNLLLAILCIGSTLISEELSVQEIMSPGEMETMGVNRMTPQQRRAFEAWITHWTATVLSQSSSYHPSLTIPQWVSQWPKHLLPKPIPQEEAIKEKREANQNIFRNTNGEVLELNDGSVWIVNPIDRSVARWWRRGDPLLIKKAKYDIARPYTLFNQANNEQVGAKMAKPSSPQGERKPESPGFYQGSIILASIGMDGQEVTLKDESSWKISPMYQLQVMSTWTIGDRIRIEPSGDSIYRYRLVNLDSGDNVLGNPSI